MTARCQDSLNSLAVFRLALGGSSIVHNNLIICLILANVNNLH